MLLTTRRRVIKGMAAGTAAAFISRLPAQAQTGDSYPTKPIRLVVPYPAGGTTDQLARAIAQPMR